MVETIEQKLIETSVQGVDKSRRNFLKYLTGGLVGTAVAGGLGYLGYERFRGPSWDKKIKMARNNEEIEGILIEIIYRDPEEAKKYILNDKKTENRFKNYNFDSMTKEDITLYGECGYSKIKLPNDSKKLSESDKLLIFFRSEIGRAAGAGFF